MLELLFRLIRTAAAPRMPRLFAAGCAANSFILFRKCHLKCRLKMNYFISGYNNFFS